jgi:hypothetical protein
VRSGGPFAVTMVVDDFFCFGMVASGIFQVKRYQGELDSRR